MLGSTFREVVEYNLLISMLGRGGVYLMMALCIGGGGCPH